MKFSFQWHKLLSVLCCFILYYFTFEPYGLIPKVLAVISSFFVFDLLVELVIKKKISNIFFVSFIGLNWMYFQSPFLLKEKTEYFPRVILDEYIPEISLYTCLAIILIYFGTKVKLDFVRPMSSKEFKMSNAQVKKISIFFACLGLLYRCLEIYYPSFLGVLSNLVQILFYSATISFAFFVLFQMRRKEKFGFGTYEILLLLYFSFEFFYRISTTMFVNIAVLFIGGLLCYIFEKRKLPIITILLVSLVFTPLYQTRKYYRDNMGAFRSKEDSRFSVGTRVFSDIVKKGGEVKYSKFNKLYNSKKEKKFNRFENLSLISQLVYCHRKRGFNFLNGSTFYWLPLVPIPRVIFPGKPQNLLATELATKYGIRGRKSSAAINFPMIAEAYINFGFIGLLFIAFFIGFFLKWFVVKFGYGLGDINLLITINAFKQFTHAEGNITLVFGALIQVAIFWFVLIKVFRVEKLFTKN